MGLGQPPSKGIYRATIGSKNNIQQKKKKKKKA
jgi:hypothetical protein